MSVFEYPFDNSQPPLEKQLLEIEYKGLHSAYKKGLKIALGTDAGSFPWSVNQAKEFELLVKKAGFSPMDAIKAGTSVAAELLGQSASIGHLAPGMMADIVAVPGDPATNPLAIRSSLPPVTQHVLGKFPVEPGNGWNWLDLVHSGWYTEQMFLGR